MEVGCLEYPRASTFGSQPLDWITPPWLAWRCNPAMSPHAQETKTGTRHTEKSVERKRKKGREGGRAKWRLLSATLAERAPRTAGPMPHERNATLLRVRFQTDLWPRVLLALFVVTSFKLYVNTLNVQNSMASGFTAKFMVPFYGL